jgi:hypothetical protein
VAHVNQLDGSHRRRIGRKFKTFDAAVRLCSIYTRVVRRQVAYHEAGHAVTARLLGFTGVWIEMDDGFHRAIVRHDLLPSMLAVADGGRAALARYLYEEVMFFSAGLVAEVKIAGYPAGYVEEDTAGRTRVDWDAVRAARIEAGLPICGHKDCTIPFDADPDSVDDIDAGPDSSDPDSHIDRAEHISAERIVTKRITEADVAAVTKRAKDEVFALLKANWPTVK